MKRVFCKDMRICKSKVLYIPSTDSDVVSDANTTMPTSPITNSSLKKQEKPTEPLSNLTSPLTTSKKQSTNTTSVGITKPSQVRVSQIVKKSGGIPINKKNQVKAYGRFRARCGKKAIRKQQGVQQQLDLVVSTAAIDKQQIAQTTEPPEHAKQHQLQIESPKELAKDPSPTPALSPSPFPSPTLSISPFTLPEPEPVPPSLTLTTTTATDPVRAVLAAIEDESVRRVQAIELEIHSAEIEAINAVKQRYRRKLEILKNGVARDLFDGVKMFLQANKK